MVRELVGGPHSLSRLTAGNPRMQRHQRRPRDRVLQGEPGGLVVRLRRQTFDQVVDLKAMGNGLGAANR